jgi:hypothetical protein
MNALPQFVRQPRCCRLFAMSNRNPAGRETPRGVFHALWQSSGHRGRQGWRRPEGGAVAVLGAPGASGVATPPRVALWQSSGHRGRQNPRKNGSAGKSLKGRVAPFRYRAYDLATEGTPPGNPPRKNHASHDVRLPRCHSDFRR